MKEKVLVDVFRREMTEKVAQFFATNGEDVGYVNSNTINFPVVIGDIEKWVEVTIKVPKGTKDEEYDGYGRREDYTIKLQERADKARKSAEAKAKKIARDKARREKEEEKTSSPSSAPWPEESMHTAMMKHARGGW